MSTNHVAGDRHYSPPDHHHHHHRHNQYMMSPSSSIKGCCCCLFLLLIFLSLLLLAITLIILLALRPKKPQFDLQRVGVDYLLVDLPTPGDQISFSSSSAAYLSLNTTLLFTAVNPNKVGLKYGAANLYVLYRGVPLGIAAVPGFEQPEHSTRLVVSRVSVNRFNVLQPDAVALVRDAAVNDRVELRVTGDVGARIRVLRFDSPRVQVSVDCVIVISPRRQSLSYKQCGVDGLNV